VGDPGVGKTAIAEGLARKIIEGDVPEVLLPAVIYSLDMGALLAGTRYRGDFEERLKQVVNELEKLPHAVLFIDEIHTVIGAGATSGGAMDASNLLKPALVGRHDPLHRIDHLQGVPQSFREGPGAAPALPEDRRERADDRGHDQDHHRAALGVRAASQVKYTPDAIKSAVELSARYINDRKLPDKAIDVIDEVGAMQMLVPIQSKRKKTITDQGDRTGDRDDGAHPTEVGLDRRHQGAGHARYRSQARRVRTGQGDRDAVVRDQAQPCRPARSGQADRQLSVLRPHRRRQDEVARQLAAIMGIPLQRFDMSEYMERHSVSRLIGAPPGYVGYDQGGLLTDAVDQQPHSVLLLDEIEKAHPDLFNILLQVMDNGKLTDHHGKTVDFRNVILIMTTNAGASDMARESLGFGNLTREGEHEEAVKKMFTPEFRNRLDAIVPFSYLPTPVIARVVEKFILQLELQLADRDVHISLDDEAKAWLTEKGYDKLYGARPMGRLIQEKIKQPLAEELLFGKLVHGGEVKVHLKDGALAFEVTPAAPKPKKGKGGRSKAVAKA
jgi:ATP-dependent Clp protease ATP-binding subunit ClpA